MLTELLKRRKTRVKEGLLRGIYEDNMRIIGHAKYRRPKKNAVFLPKTILIGLITIIVILINGNYLSPFSSSDEKLSEHIEAREPAHSIILGSAGSLDFTASPADFQGFMDIPDMPLSRVFGLDVKTIMIDAGHGGSDSGAIGKMGTQEKDIVLDIAKRLKRRLHKYGNYDVLMTREYDKTVSLHERVELAKISKADLFVSIHLNFLPTKPINIIETYFFGPPADSKTLHLAEKENVGSEFSLSDFKEIIGKMGNALKLQESRELAFSLQKSLFVNSSKANKNVYNYGVKRAPFVVLLGVDVPAVLTEVSCLSNRDEETKLNTELHRENIARYLEAGILDYLNKGEIIYEAKREQERG
jgi:N-acetylmuramoyl-L-alanine amidase